VRRKALRATLQILAHKFPKIREFAAQQFYVTLLQECAIAPDDLFHYLAPPTKKEKQMVTEKDEKTGEEKQVEKEVDVTLEGAEAEGVPPVKVSVPTGEIEPVSMLLTTTNWMENEEVKPALKDIYAMFRLELPNNFSKLLVKAKPKGGKVSLLVKREVEGYAQLVNEFHGNL